MAVNRKDVSVTFNPTLEMEQQFEWSTNPDPPAFSLPAIENGSSFYALVLTLNPDPLTASGAVWADPPVVWDNNDVPPPVPENEDMPVAGTNQIVIGITNDNTATPAEPMYYGFCARVSFNNAEYSSTDPEVVLQPPS